MMQSDYFLLLGLDRRFAIDPAELERRYLERSREVHPDRQAGRPADQRAVAAGEAMQLNLAYRALKRELPRAEHLLQLAGVRIGDNEPVKQELLIEVLELREELATARAAGDAAAIARLESSARMRERAELDRLGALFAAFEAAPQGAGGEALERIKDQVILLRYLARYREAFDEDADESAA
jgi:molecular chaperone HscB